MASLFSHWPRKTVAGAIGNTLDGCDFAVCGFFAPIIATQFFPHSDAQVGLIAIFGVSRPAS